MSAARATLALALLLIAGCKSNDAVIDTSVDPNDRDDDGYSIPGDCDDTNPDIHPDAVDTVGNDVDDDCDGIDGVDGDQDGFASEASGGDDCDDTTGAINPDADDEGWNDIDEDCNGADRHDFTEIGVGNLVTCGVKTTGELLCWGSDAGGVVSGAPAGTGWSALSGGGLGAVAGNSYMCGIQDGAIRCWGSAPEGVIAGVPAGANWRQLTTGPNHACAVDADADLVCWGVDDNGSVDLAPDQFFLTVAVGEGHSCGVLDPSGAPTCWGSNGFDQSIPAPGPYLQLASGANHTCGIKENRTLACWGRDNFTQDMPPNVKGPYTDITAAGDHACGILQATNLTCWGQNNFGQTSAPTQTAVQVRTGPTHTCARNAANIVFCWGDDSSGQATVP